MAAVTLTNQTSNFDDTPCLPLLNGENITLNNSNLIIDSDVRWGQNAAVLGSLIVSSSTGGTIKIDSSKVWWIPFDAPSGNVPALGTFNVQNCTGGTSGATGEFLGIFSALGVAPTAAAAAIPSTGFIKFRSKVGTFLDNEVITLPGGATITVNSATGGQRGWINVAGAENGSITLPRLGQIRTNTAVEYFELGITNGADDQTFQYPIADVCPAIEVETSVGSGIYEVWENPGTTRWGSSPATVSQDVRGKMFGCDANGVITIARRATNACGFKPASGLRVRIPNIIISNANATNWALNVISGTLATRYDFTTTNAGDVELKGVIGHWYISLTNAYNCDLDTIFVSDALLISNIAQKVLLKNVQVTLTGLLDTSSITVTNCFSGVQLDDCTFMKRQTANTATNAVFADCPSITGSNNSFISFGGVGVVTRGGGTANNLSITRCPVVELINTYIVGARVAIIQNSETTFLNTIYADALIGATQATNGQSIFDLTGQSINTVIEGLSYPAVADQVHPYNGIVSFTNIDTLEVRNIGTPTVPLSFGTTNIMASIASGSIAKNIVLKRIYSDTNTRTSPIALAVTVQTVDMQNVWLAGADVNTILASEVLTKGCRLTQGVAPQTAIYGTHWVDAFISTTRGEVTTIMNEPLASTANQAAPVSGNPRFTSTGNILMNTIGDSYEWTMPYYALGHTSFLNDINGVLTPTNLNFIDFEYKIDTGLGFNPSYKKLLISRVTASGGAAGTNTFVITPIAGTLQPQIGDLVGTVAGTQFVAGTTVTNVVGNTITVSNNILVSLSTSTVYFGGAIVSEAITPTAGFKLKIKATANTTGALSFSFLKIKTVTNATDQQIQYPEPKTELASVSGIVTGSRIQVYNVTTSTEIANEIVPGTSWSLLYSDGDEFTVGDTVRIRLTYASGLTAYLGQQLAAAVGPTGWSALASQFLDTTYAAYGIDGSTVTKFTADYVSDQVDLNIASNFSGSELYAWWVSNLFTSQGISDFFGGLRAVDEGNLINDVGIVSIQFDNLTSTNVFQNDNIRIFRSDGNYPVVNPTTGGGGIDINWRNQVFPISVGGSALTPTESAWLSDINSRTSRVDGLIEDVSGDRFTAKALEESPAGGGGGSSDWTPLEKEQLRFRIGIDGTASAPISANPSLATDTDITSAQTAIIAEINANEAKIDIIDTVVDAIKVRTDLIPADPATNTQVNTRLAAASYVAPTNLSAAQVRTELAPELARIDVAVSTRNAVAPDNASITAIKAKTDNLPSDPASTTNINNQTTTLLTAIGTGGVTPTEIYDYISDPTRVDVFKADLTLVAKTADPRFAFLDAPVSSAGGSTDLTPVLNAIALTATSVELEAAKDEILGATVAIDIPSIVAGVRADLERLGGPLALVKIDTTQIISNISALNDISALDVYNEVISAITTSNLVNDADLLVLQNILLDAIANKVLIRKDEIIGTVNSGGNITGQVQGPQKITGIVTDQNNIGV